MKKVLLYVRQMGIISLAPLVASYEIDAGGRQETRNLFGVALYIAGLLRTHAFV